ncbi:hypothetical protein B296_00006153 [Ensete ventricosum]|uniref:Uncharacterized protein n=1 Tax=Ensete ventricosum TaxID=4639 RepID=A0A427AR32_ENSVE|nr:hypothetical protein B296_00006153 [Ensete ventricosum]
MNDLCVVVGGELEQDARNAEVGGEVVGPINKEVGEEGEGQAREQVEDEGRSGRGSNKEVVEEAKGDSH